MEGKSVNKLNGISLHLKEHSNADHTIITTINDLCKNHCESQSSIQSPSRQGFELYGDELKIAYDV